MKIDVSLDIVRRTDTVVIELEGTEIAVYGIEDKTIYLVDGADVCSQSYMLLHYVHEKFEND
jgi:hypothetical protein